MTDAGAAAAIPEYGNFEANVRFLEATGLIVPGRAVLEIGSGTGSLLAWLIAKGCDAHGLETSPDRIAESRARHGALPLQETSGTALAFPDASFDLVLSFDVFEHIPDSDAHLDEVRRVLRPGGWYLMQTPNKWTNTIFETIRWRSFTRWRADHCSLHSYRELRNRLTRHGFSVTFDRVNVVTPFFRAKVRTYLGPIGPVALAIANPDRLPLPLRTNFYLRAQKQTATTGR